MQKVISVDIHALFGFLKKPDINDGIYLTYNIIHKPALQGIFGAILGLSGYNLEGTMAEDEIPEFRKKLEGIEFALIPLNSMEGNFEKESIKYTNTIGYANIKIVKRKPVPQNLIINEQTLIKPSYQVFLKLDAENSLHNELVDSLKNSEAEYIPYLGKNDHQLWWENFMEWEIFEHDYHPQEKYKIDSLFVKPKEDERLLLMREKTGWDSAFDKNFAYFERLPKGWSQELPQYELGEFLYTDYFLDPKSTIPNLMKISNREEIEYAVQFF